MIITARRLFDGTASAMVEDAAVMIRRDRIDWVGQALGRPDDLGTVNPGADADLIAVQGDPLASLDTLGFPHSTLRSSAVSGLTVFRRLRNPL